MSERLDMSFPLQTFGLESPNRDNMVKNAIAELEKLPSYTNKTIDEVRKRILKEFEE